MNFTNVASDAQVPRTTVYEYFEILKDTLILHELPGVARVAEAQAARLVEVLLLRRRRRLGAAGPPRDAGTPEFGARARDLVLHELIAYRDYVSGEPLPTGDRPRVRGRLHPRRPHGDRGQGHGERRSRGPPFARALAEEEKAQALSLRQPRATAGAWRGITILPWPYFLDALWPGSTHAEVGQAPRVKRPELADVSRLLRHFEDDLALRYAERTVPEYVAHVRAFLAWAEAKGLALAGLRRHDLIAYQSELFALRKADGQPYSAGFQVNRFSALKSFFGFLTRRLLIPTTRSRASSGRASRRGCHGRSSRHARHRGSSRRPVLARRSGYAIARSSKRSTPPASARAS